MSALTCISFILIEIHLGHSDLDYTFYAMKLFCLQLGPHILALLQWKKISSFLSVTSLCIAIHTLRSGAENRVNVFEVDASFM